MEDDTQKSPQPVSITENNGTINKFNSLAIKVEKWTYLLKNNWILSCDHYSKALLYYKVAWIFRVTELHFYRNNFNQNHSREHLHRLHRAYLNSFHQQHNNHQQPQHLALVVLFVEGLGVLITYVLIEVMKMMRKNRFVVEFSSIFRKKYAVKSVTSQ